MTEKTREILDRLAKAYPDAACELEFEDPLQLITATVLSAQTTDKSVNKVTPPELPVSEYPLIIVRGMQLNGMVRYGGTEKEEKASVNFNAGELLKTLAKIPGAFITGGKDKIVDVLLDYAYGLFGHMGCDENGDPSDPDVSMRTFEGSAVNYPDLPGEPSVRQLGLFTSALHHYGAENLYFFSYDWRLDTYGNAALLAQEIDRAL